MSLRVSPKSMFFLALKLGVTAGALYLAVRRVDFDKMLALSHFNAGALGLAAIIALLIVVAQGLRWKLILASLHIQLSFAHALIAVWFGHLLNNILPTSVAGDLVRSYTLRYDGAASGVWLGALISEKFAAVITALLLAMLFSFSVPIMPFVIRAVAFALFVAMAFGLLFVLLVSKYFDRSKNIVAVQLSGIARSLRILVLSSPGREALATSLAINVSMAAVLFFCVIGVGANVSFTDCLFVAPLVSIVASLPISYGGWGLRELSGLELLKFLGVSPELALATLLLYGVTVLASSLPGVFVAQNFLVRARDRRSAHLETSHVPNNTQSL